MKKKYEDYFLEGHQDLRKKKPFSLFIITEDDAASIKYNRRCAHVGVLPPGHTVGCHDDEIEIQGEGTFNGKRCFCKKDLCNNNE